MKLVMTLRTRDEADIVDAQLAFHLNAGVDFVIAMDRSEDGTTEILESYAREGYLHLLRDDEKAMREGEWVTRMARLAASEFGADWVINSDADEFFWPRTASLKSILSVVPPRFGGVRAMWRHFAPTSSDEHFFADRMTVRVCNPGARSIDPYSPRFKTVHRADPEVTVLAGNHRVVGRRLQPLISWYPIDVLHFPTRSFEQCETKYLRWWELFGNKPGSVWTAAYEAHRRGEMREFYESFVVDDNALKNGVAEGTLAVDTRLRDALRGLRTGDNRHGRGFRLPDNSSGLNFRDSALDEAYLMELAALEEATSALLRSERRANNLETRLSALERRLPTRINAALRRSLRRHATPKR